MSINTLLQMIVKFNGAVVDFDPEVFKKKLIFTENKSDRKYKLAGIRYHNNKTEEVEIELEEITNE